MLAGAAGIVLLVGVLVYSLASKSGLFDRVPDKSIAVLPFKNLSDDKSNAYFAEGIQDEILTRLVPYGALSPRRPVAVRAEVNLAPSSLLTTLRQMEG